MMTITRRIRNGQPIGGLGLGVRAFVRSVSHVKFSVAGLLSFVCVKVCVLRWSKRGCFNSDETTAVVTRIAVRGPLTTTANDRRYKTGANRARIWPARNKPSLRLRWIPPPPWRGPIGEGFSDPSKTLGQPGGTKADCPFLLIYNFTLGP